MYQLNQLLRFLKPYRCGIIVYTTEGYVLSVEVVSNYLPDTMLQEVQEFASVACLNFYFTISDCYCPEGIWLYDNIGVH